MTALPFEQHVLTGITPVEMPIDDESHVVEIGIGLAAAYLAYRWWVKPRLAEHKPRTPEESRTAASLVIRGAREVWERLARPAVMAAYTASTAGSVPYPVVEKMAQAYIDELGEYVDSTSVDALVEGFTAQISNGWGEGISWMRASEGFGLDGRQMRSYLSGLMGVDKTYTGDPIPPQVIKKVDMAVMRRADLLGMNESRKAIQMGKNMVWLAMAAQGDLPPGTMKKWVTAEDERVCEICGPLDQVTIPLHQQFQSVGQKFYAPVVHPNCRCNLEIVYPKTGIDVIKKSMWLRSKQKYDPHNRTKEGLFSANEERVQLVGDQQERAQLVGDQQQRAQLVGETLTRTQLVGEERAQLVGETRAVLRPITDVVEEVEQIADAAVAAQGKPLKVWKEPAYIPATMLLKKEHPSWLDEFYGDLLGRHITLDAHAGYTVLDTSGDKHMYSEAFFNAVEDDAPIATLTAVGRNRESQQQAGEEMGGLAMASAIAPGIASAEHEQEYEYVRDSMEGLSHRQLLNAADAAMRNPSSDNPILYLDSDAALMGTEDMLGWMETLDVNTLASEIFTAYHREKREIDAGRLRPAEAAWGNVIEVIKDAAAHGDKKGVFDYGDIGQTNVDRAPIYLFRVHEWLGDKPGNNMYLADTDLAEISGVYEIVRVRHETLPISVQTELTEHGKSDMDVYRAIDGAITIDLRPVGLTETEVTDEGR